MACLEFTVLYTHQKTKKSKVWQDGILKSTVGGNKATLLDDKGQILDSIFLKFQIKPGDELESERYLITVEDGKASGINSSDLPSVAKKSLTRSHLKPFASSSLHLPVGLKRKNTGFQGPRHVEKKMVAREEYAMIELPSSKFPDSPFAPHFQDSSPLFSVPYKKEGMNLFSTLNSNAFIQTNKDANSDTSWDCKPCVNEYKLAESTSSNIKGTDVDYVKPEFHLDTKMINSGYPIRNDGTISQNVRSKAQILELLNHRQTDSKHRKDERALRKSEFHQQSLHLSEPSRITSSLCQRKTVFLPECTDKTIKEGAGLILPLCSPEKNVHRKSRWDVYLSLPSAEKNPGEDDVEQNDNDLQNFKEDNIAESPFIENWQRNPCVPSSLEIENISAIRKSSVESLVDASLSTKSILNKGNDLETKSPFGNIHCSDSVNAAKTFQEKASKFNKHTVISDMDESCQLMQNDSCSVLYSENFSNSSTFDSQTESHQQITEVNFNLFDTLECSDTENEGVQADGILSQGTISFEKERETNGFSIQKNCVMHTYSSSQVENKVQDKGMDYVSRSQPLHIGNKVFQETNKMKRSIAAPQKSSQYSEITIVDKKIEAKAISSQNMNESKDLNCTDADFLIKNNRDSVVNNDYHNQTTWLQETEVIDCVPAISNSYSRNKSTEKSIKNETKISQPNSVGMHHITKPANPLLAFAKRNSSDYFFQCISEKKYAASEGLCDLDLRPIATSDISPISKMERVCVLDSFHKTDEEKEEDSLYVKPSNIDSSSLPQLVNRVSLLRSLTEHSTALESLQMLDESNSIICERGGLGKNDSLGSEVKKTFADASCSENVQIPPPTTHCGSSKVDTSELVFPSAEMVHCANPLKRQVHVPVEFQSPAQYKQIFTAALIEHLNIQLSELSQKLHKALGEVDISFCTAVKAEQGQENMAPHCKHKIATKLIAVKKEGRNKGRLFYACDAPKADRCDFFKWLEDISPGQVEKRHRVVLCDTKSVGTYLRSQKLSFYEECELLMRKGFESQRKPFGKLKKFSTADVSFDYNSKIKLYLKLNRKEHSSVYSKDDVWVVSRSLTFEPLDTFIACSVFFGPTSSNQVELLPLKGYSPSNWHSNMVVHALLVCNASTELTTLRNIAENVNSVTLPIMQNLLTKNLVSSDRTKNLKFKPPAIRTNMVNSGALNPERILNLANRMVQTFHLNKDQAMALIQIGAMMTSEGIDTEKGKHQALPITVIHEIFKVSEAIDGKRSVPWKVLVSSSTNVAVDRVLLCLLDLGFEEFIRVGSIRKIAKPVLPYSLHVSSGPENEQLRELLALLKEDLTPGEKILVKKTIEHHKLGTNKALLQQVKVVGATCAACPFPCMKNLKFPVVLLDESSQMTEPASLLPIARFECAKLVLVGDPKQLPPTIQGSESVHSNGLEQTLFDRLCLMGHEPILLRTQYRCHPAISAITKDLFYDGNLLNGISEEDRNPLTDWLPTLCFYNVNGLEQMERDNSFYNMAEAFTTVKLIQSLIASGLEGSMMGVITLYKSQRDKIRNLLDTMHSNTSEIKAVQVSTVDAFQGAEKEVIVLSCVRTRQVGFIDSEKRVNVALTRGKRHLLIVGNLNCLRKNKLWGCVIQHCAGRKNGLQHVSQIEQRLNDIIKSFLEKKEEEEINRQQEKVEHFHKKQVDEDTFLSAN